VKRVRAWRSIALAAALAARRLRRLPAKQRPCSCRVQRPSTVRRRRGGVWPAKEWWKRYQDPTLDPLIDMAVASSRLWQPRAPATPRARHVGAHRGAASGARVDADADIDRQRSATTVCSRRHCSVSPGTTRPTWDLQAATPSTGGASSAMPSSRDGTRRMPARRGDRSAARADAGRFSLRMRISAGRAVKAHRASRKRARRHRARMSASRLARQGGLDRRRI